MGIAQAFAEHDAAAVMRLQRESEHAAGYEHALRFREHRREIGEIDERICGDDEVRADICLGPQAFDEEVLKLDEEAVLGGADDQAGEFFAQR